jgi:hypothetical protein
VTTAKRFQARWTWVLPLVGACNPDIEQVECYSNADCTGLGVCAAGRCEVDPNAERSDASPTPRADAGPEPDAAAPARDAAAPARDAAAADGDGSLPRYGPETLPAAPDVPPAAGSLVAPVRLIPGVFEDGPMLSALTSAVFLMVKAVDDQV